MSIDTRASLIKSAEYMLRSKGYAAFSYADLEKVVGIKKRVFITIFQKRRSWCSHYRVIYTAVYSRLRENRARFSECLWPSMRIRFSFRAAMSDGMLPLCGALAAEMAALPDKLQVLTRQYFEIQLKWIKKLLMKELHAVNYLLKVTHTKKLFRF